MPVRLEAIVPKQLFKLPLVRAEMFMEMGRQIDIIDRMYGATYRSWSHKPQFKKAFRTAVNFLEAKVSTIDVIYAWVDDGTKPHAIIPKRSPLLVFPSSFTPKTNPRIIGSRRGSKSGSAFASHVAHPGTRPRNFTKEIVKRRAAPYVKQMQAAIKRGVTRVA
jgi:hypothetical protein